MHWTSGKSPHTSTNNKTSPLSLFLTHRGAKKQGRHGTKYTEEQEDAALLQDEEDEHVGHRLTQQPSVIKGGAMRKYQLDGLNWLIHLFDNGINGILADEMASSYSLGFCLLLQVIASVKILHYNRTWGIKGLSNHPERELAHKTCKRVQMQVLFLWSTSSQCSLTLAA